MFLSLPQVISWISVYGYVLLFPLVVAEGPLATIVAGMLAAQGMLNLWIAYIVILAADIVGDTLYYAAGYWGKEKFIKHFGHYFGVDMHTVKPLEVRFKEHDAKLLIWGKITHITGGPLLVAAGIVRLPLPRFLLLTFIPTVPKSLFIILVGYYFGLTFIHVGNVIDYAAFALLVFLGLLAAFYFRKQSL